ncbi:MAG TPA: helix-turn-helix domain-containing protein [Stackebrandtia sp.]|uniref:helix-turn-helix domain-containing protein n=1 Tax=Stackebrandtia sp. TaxID=2023065 RepID=UPI002D222224|nr:helix-turn-helix domain-containing protein [Stackebrandtia sp.]HZE40457.1 helix-turn-helix domain-containing protein [Stackebrandtia sp.]
MTTNDTDRLAAILDAVSGCLEQPRLCGAELAGRTYLSRFHFDRLVAASLGEPPGAFRRRLLLERAAYQLVTDDRAITHIAFAAGYQSHEAFTRAFRRGFGHSPSRHRAARQPRYRIAAANGIHFHPPGGIRLPATERNVMTVLNNLIDHHVWCVGALLERARTVDDSVLDKPIEYHLDYGSGEMSARDLLAQVVWQFERWLAATEGGRGPDDSGDTSIPALIRRHQAVAGPWADKVKTALEEGRLDETFINAQPDPPETFTYGGMVSHVIYYGTIHRALAVGALSAAGIENLPSSDPMRWMAELG